MTYGSQQAVTAEALCELLRSDWRTTEIDIPTVVWLRDQMRLALLERLQIIRGRYAPVKDVEPRLDQIANNAHQLLPVILATTPWRDLAAYPSDDSMLRVLSHPSDEPTIESWRRAAASITIANHDLDQGDDQPWLRRHGPHWQLVEDAATAVEAFLVLDDRLEAMGALRGHSLGGRQFTLRGARTLTSAIAREAAWGADTSADLVAARPMVGPVQVVRGADDLISGHRRLTGMIEPSSDSRRYHRDLVDVRLARVVALGQSEENRLLSLAATNLGEDRLAESFQLSAERYVAFLSASQRVRPVYATPDSKPVEFQQFELLRGTRLLGRAEVDRNQLVQLDAVHQSTARALGRALRIDLNRGNSSNPVTRAMCNIAIPIDRPASGWGRPARSGPYGRAVQALVSTSAFVDIESVATAPRAHLRTALEVTPTPIAWRRPSLQW